MRDATEGMVEYRSKAVRAAVIGGVGVVAAAAIGTVSEDIAIPVGTLGAMALVAGAMGLLRVWRIRRRVAREGWRVRAARFRVDTSWGPNGQPALYLERSDDEPDAILSLSTTVFRWEALDGATELWVVGNPRSRFAAVATPDGRHVVVVKRPWSRWWARRLRRIVGA